MQSKFPQARDYQIKAIEDISRAFGRGDRHVLLTSPTGTGKTYIFSMLAKLTSDKGNRVLVLTDRTELLKQAGGSFSRFGLRPFFIQAGCKFVNQKYHTFVAMSQTLKKRADEPDEYWTNFFASIDLIIIDECHKQEFNWLFESEIARKKFVIGVTATPKRSGKMRQLGLDYDTIVETITVRQAIERGYLVNCEFYDVGGVSADSVAYDYKKGDYQEKSMFNAFNNGKMYRGLITNYENICPGTKTMVFCCNIEHSIRTAMELRDSGYTVKYLVSAPSRPTVPDDLEDKSKCQAYKEKKAIYDLYNETFKELSGERADIFAGFENNRFQFFVNAGIATTGYDCPDVETVVINRLTSSVSMWLQIMGRGSRPYDGKTHFNVLYFGDNKDKLGAYDSDREWSLWHEESKEGGLPPMKMCGIDSNGKPLSSTACGCKRLIPAIYQICPFADCGYRYPIKEVKEAELQLSAYDSGRGAFVNTKRVTDMTYKELTEYRAMKNHPQSWLWIQIYIRGGADEMRKYGREYFWKQTSIDKAVEFCEKKKIHPKLYGK